MGNRWLYITGSNWHFSAIGQTDNYTILKEYVPPEPNKKGF